MDDICDGGGTFIPLAQKLKDLGAKEVNLYVTHMIGAKGLDIFKGVVDNVFCYQVVGTYLTMKDVQDYNKSTIQLEINYELPISTARQLQTIPPRIHGCSYFTYLFKSYSTFI